MSGSLLDDAFDHHVWATLRLIDACLQLTAEQLQTAVPGTYGSILHTMRHVVGSDPGYLYFLTGDHVHDIETEELDLPELRARRDAAQETRRASIFHLRFYRAFSARPRHWRFRRHQ